jgi:hypothetical protein
MDGVGNRGRQRLDVELAGHLLEDPALLDPRGLLRPVELENGGGLDGPVQPHPQHVHVQEAAADRVALLLLDHHRRGPVAVERQLDHRPRVAERLAQRAQFDLEGLGRVPPTVDHARHAALATQAAGGPRALGDPRPDR